jgi:hypothetical protein
MSASPRPGGRPGEQCRDAQAKLPVRERARGRACCGLRYRFGPSDLGGASPRLALRIPCAISSSVHTWVQLSVRSQLESESLEKQSKLGHGANDHQPPSVVARLPRTHIAPGLRHRDQQLPANGQSLSKLTRDVEKLRVGNVHDDRREEYAVPGHGERCRQSARNVPPNTPSLFSRASGATE